MLLDSLDQIRNGLSQQYIHPGFISLITQHLTATGC